jgi:hypothetical protein
MGDKLERMAKEIFRQNDQRAATSLQRDELYAAFVNGMVVNKVADLRYNAARWDKYARSRPGASPFYIRALNPAHVYFEYDDYGVCEVLHRYLRPLREVVRVYGVGAPGLANVKPDDANGYVLFSEYWTDELSAKWIEQVYMYGEDANYVQGVMSAGESVRGYFVEEPIKNEFGFIPYVVRVARGSSIFSRTNMVYPHLYSGHKSKLFLRNNLFLTMASTLAFMLVNPQVVHESENGETTIEFDFSKPNAYAIRKGEKITPVELKITQDFYNVMTQFGEMMEESTVSKVVAGQSPGGVTAAAGINLLIGGGKLTVSPVQAALGEVRQGAIANVFDYVRSFPRLGEGASALSMYLGGELAELDPASLPDFMDINVKYNAFLPQDKALAVQTWLTPLMQKLISSDYFYEQVGVQDVGTMRKQIDEDITRMIPEDQLQAGQPPPEQLGAGAPEGVPGQTGTQAQETVVNQPTQNPMEQTQNPANALNDLYNSIQSPMQAAQ